VRGSIVAALAGAASLFVGCAAPHPFATPDASWQTHTGQLKFTSGGRVIIGEVVVRRRGAREFQLDFQKGGAIPLLKLRLDATTARVEGLLARGTWQGAPEQAPKPLRGWIALREAFVSGRPPTTFTSRDSQDRFDFVFSR
jgi:hypothetical protein